MRKFYIGLIVGAVILAVLFPISLNFFIGENEILGFSIKTVMSKDAWLGFWGSYFGAIGTIILGISTYLQSKKYNDMSNHFVEEQKKILENIEALNKQQQITIKTNKYYEILENYRDKIETLSTKFKKYNPIWASRFFLYFNDDKEIEYNTVKNDLMLILSYLQKDTYFFEDKELLYDDCCKYVMLFAKQYEDLKQQSKEVNEFNVNTVQEAIDKMYESVRSKFYIYTFRIEKYQRKILLGTKSIEEIEKDFLEMQVKHKSWIPKIIEAMEQRKYNQ